MIARLLVRPALFGCAAVAAMAAVAAATEPRPGRSAEPTFKVATWNIRSGMGVRGFGAASWDDETLNCADSSKPVNAWSLGLPQQELLKLAGDPGIVALAVQEAWNCATPSRINSVIRFKAATREYEGVALLARHGFRGDVVYRQIDRAENRWLIGGHVCLDSSCTSALPMFSTHWGAPLPEYPRQARATVAALQSIVDGPHLFMGDLNVYRLDRWSPWAPCADQQDAGGRVDAIAIVSRAGYVDAWSQTHAGPGWTGMASRRGCGRPHGGPFKRIDYVFAKGATVVSTARFARALPGRDAPSDHLGVIAEIEQP